MSNRVIHFEIPSANPDRTMQFFTDVFGWSFQRYGEADYWFAQTGDPTAPGINGAVMKKRDPQQPLVNAIDVADLDMTLDKIAAAGGEVVVPKTEIPGVGWNAFFKDPDGNIHGVWQASE